MQIGQFYKHPKFKDVCVQVIDDLPDGRYLVEWWNLGYTGNPWPMGVTDYIYINGNWENITNKMKDVRGQFK